MARILDRIASFAARATMTWLGERVEGADREWIEAMRQELDAIPSGRGQLAWAFGGLRFAAGRRWRSRPRHPAQRLVALVLGAPEQALDRPNGHDDPGTAAIRAFLLVLLSAAFTAGAVLVLFRLLEDSPYAFNLGRGAPAGIHPDFTNPMSLAWDLVVLGSCAEFLSVAAAAVCLVLLACTRGETEARAASRRLDTALVVAGSLLWIVVGATVLWGLVARGAAPTIFAAQDVVYLHLGSWLVLIGIMAASAALASGATAQSLLRLRGS